MRTYNTLNEVGELLEEIAPLHARIKTLLDDQLEEMPKKGIEFRMICYLIVEETLTRRTNINLKRHIDKSCLWMFQDE